jgi:hypothetical protein
MRALLNGSTFGGLERHVSAVDSAMVANVLRDALGSDQRYRKFVKMLASPRTDGLLHFWQSAALDTLEATRGLVLPRRAPELRALLPPLPDPPRLDASDVPTWIRIAEIGGSAPVQAYGSAGSWRWYFRARHNDWSLGAVRGHAGDPVGVSADSDVTFYAEDEYGDEAEDASYMDLDEARFFIVRELTRLKESRGLDMTSA